ncbi:MAG: hypothetical protein E8D43_03570 [Nitrospira sp.]|nr:MAG: hypothetical protein E8D43_03570 [Nitrospira sp.]
MQKLGKHRKLFDEIGADHRNRPVAMGTLDLIPLRLLTGRGHEREALEVGERSDAPELFPNPLLGHRIQPVVGNGLEAANQDTVASACVGIAEGAEQIVHRSRCGILERTRLLAKLTQHGRAFGHFQQGKASQTIHRRALG